MPNLVPGAIWQPIDVGGRAARRKGRGIVGHVAVSNSVNLKPTGTPATRGADWHLYLPKSGPPIQYIDLDVQCWATGAGNADLVAWESQGGMGTTAQVNAEPWTDNQLHWAAVILAHLNRTEGVPLQVMPDSKAASKGFATHRLGISPWRVAGGQVWSSANGKLCPGDAKHNQRARIVELARQMVAPPATLTPDQEDDVSYDADKANLYATLNDIRNGLAGWVQENVNAAVKVMLADSKARAAAYTEVLSSVAAANGTTVDMAAIEAAVEKGVAEAIAGIDTTTTITVKPAS